MGRNGKVIPVQDHKGVLYRSETAMCKAYGISRGTYRSRIAAGWSQKDALELKIGATYDTLKNPIEWNGEKYYSYKAFATASGINDQSAKYCLGLGFGPDDIVRLTKAGIALKSPTSDHKGNVYGSIKHMCQVYNISPDVYQRKLQRGYSKKDALDPTIKLPGGCNPQTRNNIRTDHHGITYATKAEMLKTYHVSKKRFDKLIEEGASLEEALTPFSDSNLWMRTDIDGTVYPTVKEFAKAHGIADATYKKYARQYKDVQKAIEKAKRTQDRYIDKNKLIWRGKQYNSVRTLAEEMHTSPKTLEKAWEINLSNDQVEYLLKQGKIDFKHGIYTDHLGNIFPSEKSMCLFYHTDQKQYRKRLKKGMTSEEALTLKGKTALVTDHLGNKYNSLAEMCDAYHITKSTYFSRKSRGLTLEERLLKGTRNIIVRGKRYVSIADFLKKNQIGYDVYKNLKAEYSTPAEALEICLRKKEEKTYVCDHLGNRFKNISTMCRHYHVRFSTYQYRIKSGQSPEQALTTPSYEVINTTSLMQNGLSCTIVGVDSPTLEVGFGSGQRKKIYKMRFEDGIEVHAPLIDFIHGTVHHPELTHARQNKVFHGIEIKYITKSNKRVFYNSYCPQCNIRDIWTPHEMIMHVQTAHNQ